jgi:mRNA interferase MazF
MPRRGEIWWARLDPTVGSEIAKTRPCVVITSNILNERRRTAVVVPLSTSPQASPPILVPVRCEGREVVAVTDQVRAVAKERLERLIGQMADDDLAAVEQGLKEILELD